MKTLKKIFEAILVSCGYDEKESPKVTTGTMLDLYSEIESIPREEYEERVKRIWAKKEIPKEPYETVGETEYLLKNKNNANHLEKSIGEYSVMQNRHKGIR